MAKLTESVSAITPLGDALREPAKAPRKRRESTTPEPLGVAWSCPCHGTRFDDLREVYLHIRAELQARTDIRDSLGRRRIAICGTFGGYEAHRRKGEQTCEPCRVANNERYREKRKRNPRKIRAQQTAWRAANTEKVYVKQAKYRAANIEKVRAREAAYRAAHRERERARVAAYYAANREQILARQAAPRAAYRAENREAINARRRAQRAARKAAQQQDAA